MLITPTVIKQVNNWWYPVLIISEPGGPERRELMEQSGSLSKERAQDIANQWYERLIWILAGGEGLTP